ncbi:integral membrane protein [Microbacterium proteolyticum]|uniref:Integral membrane protein n=1 Tax=Microbacterium proteolyticum TaxID=1572644 RepID=A0A7W5CL08_9MICO|nr:integral membrane protein [Microbacterium proteolyticum]
MFRTPLNLFRTLAIAEAVSWTLLIGGLILRAVADLPLAVTIGGGIHGFVFLAYGATAVLVALNQRWGIGPTALAIVSAVIPYATVPTEIWLHRTGRLRGAWRLDETADPRDRRPIDRMLRFFLRRPWALALALVAVVAVVFVVLLVVGPPGGKG